ncbi:MAG: hypothetical protein RLY31_2722 [Bacteroidota bacterium]|jgi:hypothetical protein
MKVRRQLVVWLVPLGVCWLVRDLPFFWDTIQLGSKHAHFFFESDFRTLILPTELDSGHPPLFGLYLALLWKWLGKSLLVSHFAMMPFLVGILWVLFRAGDDLVGSHQAWLLPLLCFADPVLASQAILVSPDIPLVFFFLLAAYGGWRRRQRLLVPAIIGLGLVSLRGMMLSAGLFVFLLWWHGAWRSARAMWQVMWPFLPGGLLASAWLAWHWYVTGWIGYHAQSTWAPSFERVDLVGFLWNLLVLGWRLSDYGHVFSWLAVGVTGWLFLRRNPARPAPSADFPPAWENIRALAKLTLCTLVALVPTQLLHKGLLAHRYLLPVYIPLNLLAGLLLLRYLSVRTGPKRWQRTAGVWLLATLLAVGNAWVYPERISQGWDSTLAHLGWYPAMEEALAYLDREGIPLASVGTAFPAIGPLKYARLGNDMRGMVEKNLQTQDHILYSNVMNDFSDDEIDRLQACWQPMRTFRHGKVFLTIYRQSREESCAN